MPACERSDSGRNPKDAKILYLHQQKRTRSDCRARRFDHANLFRLCALHERDRFVSGEATRSSVGSEEILGVSAQRQGPSTRLLDLS